jgi:hypothetical protein
VNWDKPFCLYDQVDDSNRMERAHATANDYADEKPTVRARYRGGIPVDRYGRPTERHDEDGDR